MLTGKAKEDFERWKFMNSHTYIYALPEIFQISLIIEWLDTVEIYILPFLNSQIFSFDVKEYLSGELKLHIGGEFNTRNEAIISAIEKSNEIYNYSK